MPIRESAVFHRKRDVLPQQVLSRREARLAQIAAEVRRNEMPAHGIEPRRGIHRPVVVLTITDGTPTAAAKVEPCVKAAAAAIGIKDCSVCEAIRERRPARGHVLRYLDQVEIQGVVRDGYFHASSSLLDLALSDREREQVCRSKAGKADIALNKQTMGFSRGRVSVGVPGDPRESNGLRSNVNQLVNGSRCSIRS